MLTFEDFHIGRVFALGPYTITQEEIMEFAREFDPQPLHLDPESTQAKQVGGIVASGWHTASILMRMMCDCYLLDTKSQGSPGMDEVRWLIPVRPGDELSGTVTVTERRESKSNPNIGIIRVAYSLENQNDETVMTMSGLGMLTRADAGQKT